jgi:hypothetical protein
MNYGKNQQALLKFLHRHPNRWHRITRQKAISAAKRLLFRLETNVGYTYINNEFYVSMFLPEMLVNQNG